MTLLYYDPRFLEHNTGTHPERPARLEQVVRHLQRVALDEQCTRPAWQPATAEQLARCHDADYLAAARQFAAAGGGRIEEDTVVSPASFDVACLAAGAAIDATQRVVAGEDRSALCLVRPPGHHALRHTAMGFCLLGNVALAARHAVAALGLSRVLVVDWDVHHGNGTQDEFYRDPQVSFLSIHRWPFYPGTGDADETGAGPGLGLTRNLPIEFGTSRADYLAAFRNALETLADEVRPELLLLSAGFDSHRDDPVGSLGLEIEDFVPLTQMVQRVADAHAGGRIVSVLEGGYNPGILAGCVEVHLRELLGATAAA